MLRRRVFNIVLVKPGNGVGETSSSTFDKMITYDGHAATYAL